MIISGGVNIYPEEIEAVLSTHPAVADVAVFGAPHPDLGEQVVAIVEVRPGAPTPGTAEELTEFCKTRLARFKAPRRIELVDELPRLPTGKLNKAQLRDRYTTGPGGHTA
jgi:acyl-CoA synthetase (AMP-forming)/AMP-acid ligase II